MHNLIRYELKKSWRLYLFYFFGMTAIVLMFVLFLNKLIIDRSLEYKDIGRYASNLKIDNIRLILPISITLLTIGVFSIYRSRLFEDEYINSCLNKSLPYSTAQRLSIFLLMTLIEVILSIIIAIISISIIYDSFISLYNSMQNTSFIENDLIFRNFTEAAETVWHFTYMFFLSQLFIFLSHSIANKFASGNKKINIFAGLLYVLILLISISFLILCGNGIYPSFFNIVQLDFGANMIFYPILAVVVEILAIGTLFYLHSLPSENKNPIYRICAIAMVSLTVLLFLSQLSGYAVKKLDRSAITDSEYNEQSIDEASKKAREELKKEKERIREMIYKSEVTRELLLEMADEHGIVVTDKELENHISINMDFGLPEASEQKEELLKKYGTLDEYFKTVKPLIRESIIINKLKYEVIYMIYLDEKSKNTDVSNYLFDDYFRKFCENLYLESGKLYEEGMAIKGRS